MRLTDKVSDSDVTKRWTSTGQRCPCSLTIVNRNFYDSD